MYKLSELLIGTSKDGEKENYRNIVVSDIVCDSKKVTPLCMFVCLKGQKSDGHKYIGEAIKRGARVVVCDKNFKIKEDITVINVDFPHSDYAKIMANAYGQISKKIKIIGVTGTNGKTTVTNLIYGVLNNFGKKAAVIGTVGGKFCDEKDNLGTMTTPDPEILYPLIKKYYDKGAEYIIMEVSSHALALRKVDGIKFAACAYTNISPEHLDFHKNMENYAKAKEHLSELSEKAVFCIDDNYTEKIFNNCKKAKISVSTVKKADIISQNVVLQGISGVKFEAVSNEGKSDMFSKIPGIFTVSNVLVCIGVLKILGFSMDKITEGIKNTDGVAGRMEKLQINEDFSVIIDFAHTPMALEKLLLSIKEIKSENGKILTLFGCGGNRDKTKRKVMGKIASLYSDFVVITSDNSRNENKKEITDEIVLGISNKRPYKVILSRVKAIEYILSIAKKDDIILLCGKGHEEYEIDKKGIHPFSEREIVCNYLNRRRNKDV